LVRVVNGFREGSPGVVSNDLDDRIQAGLRMMTEGSEGEAIAYFAALATEYPNNPRVTFALASAYDYAGQEAKALERYREASVLELPDELLPAWYAQYGSTLRNAGAYEHAIAVLEEGYERFPDNVAIACFLSLALFSAERHAEALRTMLLAVVHAGEAGLVDLHGYQRALTWYADDLITSPETPDPAPDSVG
jgi:tetratricopeptide (TPR) repeat protein